MFPEFLFKVYPVPETLPSLIPVFIASDLDFKQSVDTKSLNTFGLYKDQLRTQILKNKYQLGTKSDSLKEN